MLSKTILIGRTGADPEVRYTPDGNPVVSLRLATDESYKDKNGEKIKRTEWHNIVLFGKSADNATNYITKGRLLYIEGRNRTRSWEGQDGIKRYTTEIIAYKFLLLDSAKRAENGGSKESSKKEEEPAPWNEEAEYTPFNGTDPLLEDDVPF